LSVIRLLAIQSVPGLGFLNSGRDAISRNTYCPSGDLRRIHRPVRGLHTLVGGHFTPLHNANDFIIPLVSFCFNVPAIICCPIFPVLLTHFLVTGLRIFPGGHLGSDEGGEGGGVELLEERLRDFLREVLREALREVLREALREVLREVLEERLRELLDKLLLFSSAFPVRVSGLIHLRLVPEHIFPPALQSLSFLQDLLIYIIYNYFEYLYD